MTGRPEESGTAGAVLAHAVLESLDALQDVEHELTQATQAERHRKSRRLQRTADAYRASRTSPAAALRLPVRVCRALSSPTETPRSAPRAAASRSTPAVALVPLRASAPTDRVLAIHDRSAKLAGALRAGRRLRVGVLVAPATLHGLAREWDVVALQGASGVGSDVELDELDLLVVEPPSVAGRPPVEMVEVITACHARGIPSVLWASSDPVNRASHLTIARRVDQIITPDLGSAPWYARQLLHDRIRVCPPAAAGHPDVLARTLAHSAAGLQEEVTGEIDLAATRLVQTVISPERARSEIAPLTYPAGAFERRGVGRAMLSRLKSGLSAYFEGDGLKTWYVPFGGTLDLADVVGPDGAFELRFELERAGTGTLGVNISWSDEAGRPIPGSSYHQPGHTYRLVPPENAARVRVLLSVRGTGVAVVRSIALAPNLSPFDETSKPSDPDGWSRALEVLGATPPPGCVAVLASSVAAVEALLPGPLVRLTPGTAEETVSRARPLAVVLDRAALSDGPWAGAESAAGTRLARELARTAATARSLDIPVAFLDSPGPVDVHSSLIRNAGEIVVSPGVEWLDASPLAATATAAMSALVSSRFSGGAR